MTRLDTEIWEQRTRIFDKLSTIPDDPPIPLSLTVAQLRLITPYIAKLATSPTFPGNHFNHDVEEDFLNRIENAIHMDVKCCRTCKFDPRDAKRDPCNYKPDGSILACNRENEETCREKNTLDDCWPCDYWQRKD